jgi:lysophospholipase L1-like esterase
MSETKPSKTKKWITRLLKAVLLFLFAGFCYDYIPVLLKSSTFAATVFIYFVIGLIFIGLSFLLKKLGIKNHREILFSSIILLCLLLGTETILRFVVKTHLDYCETSGNPYRARLFEQNIDSKEVPYPPFDTVWTSKTEFSYFRIPNEQGIFENRIGAKRAGEKRFLCLGDSFTEGVGTTYDSTWVKDVEQLLKSSLPNRDITFINAGLSGSDPFAEYTFLETKLLDYQPDWVIMMVNNSDINEFIERGGLERYKTDGTIDYRKGPWWYQAYRYSYIVRHIAHDIFDLKDYLISAEEHSKLVDEAYVAIGSVCKKIEKLGDENGFKFVLVVQPMHYEVAAKKYAFPNFSALKSATKYSVDLMPYLVGRVKSLKPDTKYYWPLDVHYNSLGYQLAGDGVYQYLDSILPSDYHDSE